MRWIDLLTHVGFIAAAGIGLWSSAVMLIKSRRAEQGLLAAPSVVETTYARLFFGIPNSLIGLLFYVVVLAESVSGSSRLVRDAIVVESIPAALVSAYLAYVLVTKTLSCSNCWRAHASNVCILLLALINVQNLTGAS